jgi:pimeloyl-ACP methyl ester carboxylesterase
MAVETSSPAADAFLSAYDELLATRWPQPVERLDVPTGYGRTRVNASGRADGPPLLLIPGGMLPGLIWYADAARLGEDCRVYTVDTLGQPGRSEFPPRGLRTVDDMTSWLGELLDGLGLESAYLAGHSYGAWLALTLALRAPGRVRGAALLDPSECFMPGSVGYRLRAAPLFLRPSGPRLRSFVAWETGGAELDEPWLQLASLAVESGLLGKVVMPKRPSEAELRGCEVPVLVLTAGRSRHNRADVLARRAVELLPAGGVEVVALDGAAHHDLPVGHAPAIDARLREWIAACEK